MSRIIVFISYAREDAELARRLYQDLRKAGLNPWLDEESILPGQDWENEIRTAIRSSRYFIPLFSSISIKKRGYVQKEFKFALDVFKEFPPSSIFAIPVRLDDCKIPYEDLRRLIMLIYFLIGKVVLKKY